MKQRIVVDTSAYLSYAAYNKLYRLADVSRIFGVIFYIDLLLHSELKRNLPKIIKQIGYSPLRAISDIEKFTTLVQTIPLYLDSPDKKDNFLFDIAIQTDSEAIITKEIALLGFSNSPVPIHGIKWFKETFPVPL